MSIDSSHLVFITLDNSLEHVLNVGADGSDGSQLLLLAEPFLHLDGVSASGVAYVFGGSSSLHAFCHQEPQASVPERADLIALGSFFALARQEVCASLIAKFYGS